MVFEEGEGTHPLFEAIQNDHLDLVKEIIRTEPSALSLFFTNWDGTPLLYAIWDSKLEAALYIIEQGPDQDWDFETPTPTRNWGHGWTAMEAACYQECLDIVKALVKRGADPTRVSRGTMPIHWAIRAFHDAEPVTAYLLTIPAVRARLNHLTEVTLPGRNDYTLISVLGDACRQEKPCSFVIQRLLEAGADPTFPNNEGSPLNIISDAQQRFLSPPNTILATLINPESTRQESARFDNLRDLIQDFIRIRCVFKLRLVANATNSKTIATKSALDKSRACDAAPRTLRTRIAENQPLPIIQFGEASIPSQHPAGATVLCKAVHELPDDVFTDLMQML